MSRPQLMAQTTTVSFFNSTRGFYGNAPLTMETLLLFYSSCEWKLFLFDSQ